MTANGISRRVPRNHSGTLGYGNSFVELIKLSGAREKVSKKTYVRANRYPSPGFDKALADCKADKSWGVVETSIPGHVVMLDAPEWLADQLLQAA